MKEKMKEKMKKKMTRRKNIKQKTKNNKATTIRQKRSLKNKYLHLKNIIASRKQKLYKTLKNINKNTAKLAGYLSILELDNILEIIKEDNSKIYEIVNTLTVFDFSNLIKRLKERENGESGLYNILNSMLRERLNLGGPSSYEFVPAQQYNPTQYYYPEYDPRQQYDPTQYDYEDNAITYTQHALEQMATPKRQISKETVEEIINNNDYTLTNDVPKRRIYFQSSGDINNFIKIIASDSDPVIVITAIRNDPIDQVFTYTALQSIEKENLDKQTILDIIANTDGNIGEDETSVKPINDNRLLFIKKNLSIITTSDKKKILSVKKINRKDNSSTNKTRKSKK